MATATTDTGRRAFLRTAAGTTAAAVAAPLTSLTRAAEERRVRHAAIGVGGMGWADIRQLGSHPALDIVAICDVDTRRMAAAAAKFPEARRYQDWRELLDKEGDNIDSVNVTVPDHMHAPITMSAIALGKHVYCQKPLTHDIFEARRVAAAAERAGVVTQMGIQLSSTNASRIAVELLRNGAIGKVREVHLWSNKDASNYRPKGPRPPGSDPVPAEVNWDWWCGTAPVRPYVRGVYHPTWWRGWQDFGCGWLGDMGCHIMDMPYRALKLGMPTRVKAEVEPEWRDSAERRTETFPRWQIVKYTYPGTDMTAGRAIDITWSDGGKYPPAEFEELLEGRKYPAQGALLIGEDGVMLFPHGGGPRLFPQEKLKDVPRPKLKPMNHYHQFVDAILGRTDSKETRAAFSYAGPMTEMVLLGAVALRFPDQALAWDAPRMEVTNVAEANRYIRRTYRDGWEVEGL